jgi:dolichyl-phosphate-mannose-protein mannosyltransferase
MHSITVNTQHKSTPWWPGLVLFCVSVIIGLLCFKDYGVSWDEPTQRGVGRVTYDYVFKGNPLLKTYEDRDLGTGFELPLVILEKKLHLTDSRNIYLMRHIVTHLFFLCSVFCGYLLALRLFRDQFIACLAFILLAFTPRIYAHSFFNTKDIPFLSVFIIAFLVSQVAFEKNKPAWYLLLGLVCGYATSIRAMGILLFPCIGVFFLFDFVRAIYLKEKVVPVIVNALVFSGAFCGTLYVAWPLLWSAPVHFFTEEFKTMSHIFWEGNVLFRGQNINGRLLPWDYLPVWFGITVPEVWLVAGIAGFIWVIIAFLKNPKQYLLRTPERNFLLYLACFAGPVIAVTVLHSVNYDDWRHLYFIYPSFVMLALFAIHRLAIGRGRVIVLSVSGLQIIAIAFFMVSYHPFQQVYFNNLVAHKKEFLRKNYDLEYWGCSYKNGMEYILAHDTGAQIRIYWGMDPTANALRFLPADERKRVVLVDSTDHPDYFITNFRNHPQEYNYPQIVYNIEVLNSSVLRVYKMHN